MFCVQASYFFDLLHAGAIFFSCFANDRNYFFKFSVRDNRKNFLIRNSNQKNIIRLTIGLVASTLSWTNRLSIFCA